MQTMFKRRIGLSDVRHLDLSDDDRALIGLRPFTPRTISRPRSAWTSRNWRPDSIGQGSGRSEP